MSRKGFIGLGVMGFPMAGHISKNHLISVYNRSKPKVSEWLDEFEGYSSDSPEDIGRDCNEV